MDDPDLTQLNIEISVSDVTEDDIDRMTRQLLSELRETDVESAELAKSGDAPRGTKSGDPVTLGSIVISALPAVLPAAVALVQAWASRGQGRIVKFKIKGIEFEGPSEELHKILAQLDLAQPEKGKRKKK